MSSRSRQGDAPTEVNLHVIITPMLDTCFQLLFFFIIMYRPHIMEGQMQMNLPQKAEPSGKPIEPNLTPDAEPKVDAEVTVLVKTQHDGINDGIISQMVVQERGKETPVADLKALYEHLKKSRESLTNQDDIKLQGDSRLKWAGMVKVVDVCQKAGFKNPNFQAPPDRVPVPNP